MHAQNGPLGFVTRDGYDLDYLSTARSITGSTGGEGATAGSVGSISGKVVIRYGVTDTDAVNWKGRIEAASIWGSRIAVEGLHFTQQDRASNDGNFSFTTRSWAPIRTTDRSESQSPGPASGVSQRHLRGGLRYSPDARFKVSGAGDFTFSIADLAGGKQLVVQRRQYPGGNRAESRRAECERAAKPISLRSPATHTASRGGLAGVFWRTRPHCGPEYVNGKLNGSGSLRDRARPKMFFVPPRFR